MASRSWGKKEIFLKIIKAVEPHPILYTFEVKGAQVKVQEFRHKVWKIIGNQLNLDPNWVKIKWKNLRDTYARILKYKYTSPHPVKRKKWGYEDQMDFIRRSFEEEDAKYVTLTQEYVNSVNEAVISSDNVLEQVEENQDDDDYSKYMEVLENNDSTSKPNDASKKSNDQIKNTESPKKNSINKECEVRLQRILPKRKISTIDISSNLTSSKKKCVQDSSSGKKSYNYENSIDTFFQSIANNVKKLPPKIQADIKMDVCKIVSEAEISHEKFNTLQRVKKYTNMPGMIQKLVLVPCHMIDNQLKTDKS